jgi:hypothetical protein
LEHVQAASAPAAASASASAAGGEPVSGSDSSALPPPGNNSAEELGVIVAKLIDEAGDYGITRVAIETLARVPPEAAP